MKKSKKVIIIPVVIVLILAIAGGVGYYLYENSAEVKQQKFVESVEGDWKFSTSTTGSDFDITSFNFSNNGVLTTTILGTDIEGTYAVAYNKETKAYSMTVKYTVITQISRNFSACLSEDGKNLTLTDKSSGIEVKFVRSA